MADDLSSNKWRLHFDMVLRASQVSCQVMPSAFGARLVRMANEDKTLRGLYEGSFWQKFISVKSGWLINAVFNRFSPSCWTMVIAVHSSLLLTVCIASFQGTLRRTREWTINRPLSQ
jgi:hypothetical protein